MSLTEKEIRIRKLLKNDFEHYASKCLKIRTKSGIVESLILNDAQKHIHKKIEEQKAKTGKVRAIILKGRQQGCSTYVEGRFYWRVTHSKGVRAFILTHEEEATSNLFDLAKRYHDNCPHIVRPNTGASSAKELLFDKLDSGYKVGTAGNKAVGRSSTVQLFHGSEVGFWSNAQQHAAGILQAIPDENGTEVILESTANGIGNFFHEQWQKAEANQSDFIAIFVPWYWQKEYTKEMSSDFVLTAEEEDYKKAYNLTNEQICWRRSKIVQLNDENLFKQEYPATASEAFQMSGADPLIKPETIIKCRKTISTDDYGCKALGVDIARFGDDRTVISYRRGRRLHWIRKYSKKDTMETVGLVAMAIKELKMSADAGDKVFIDLGTFGAAVYDRLCEVSDKNLLKGVDFGGSPTDARKYLNKRSEMAGEFNDWLKQPEISIPDDDEIQADCTQIKYKYNSSQQLQLEKKEDMKARGLRSPDILDSIILTFAYPLKPKEKPTEQRSFSNTGTGGWMR